MTDDASSQAAGAAPRSNEDDAPLQYDANTRVADINAADPAVVDRLVAVSPAFALLRDPANIEKTGQFVSLREAAGIAGVSVACLAAAANGVRPNPGAAADVEPNDDLEPNWFEGFDESDRRPPDDRDR